MEKNPAVELLRQTLTATANTEEALRLVAECAKGCTGAERCSIFVHLGEEDRLKSLYMDGLPGIKLKSNAGIVGLAFHKRQSVIENDTSSSPVFLRGVDKKSGYTTSSLLASPILGSGDKRLGVIELLNKEGGFGQHDIEQLESLASILISLIDPDSLPSADPEPEPKPLSGSEKLQKDLDEYLADKSLYLMEDGNAYYKVTGMNREYYIGADSCYLLTPEAAEIELHYLDSQSDHLLHITAQAQIDPAPEGVFIASRDTKGKFELYPLEREKCDDDQGAGHK